MGHSAASGDQKLIEMEPIKPMLRGLQVGTNSPLEIGPVTMCIISWKIFFSTMCLCPKILSKTEFKGSGLSNVAEKILR